MRAPSRKTIRRGSILLALATLAAMIPALAQSGSGPTRQTGTALEALAAAVVEINLCADEGSLALPGPTPSVNIWGFSLDDPLTVGCDASASLPGPVLDVDVGDDVTVNLRNYLDEPVSIVFPGQALTPDSVGAPPNDGTGLVTALAATALSGGSVTTAAALATAFTGDGNDVTFTADAVGTAGNFITVAYANPGTPSALLDVTVTGTAITVSLATDAGSAISSTANDVVAAVNADGDAAPLVNAALAGGEGGTASYMFTVSNPGTFLYESGTNTAVQVAMGLYGALIVRPTGLPTQAYGAGTEYDDDQVLVLSEIDPELNNYPGGPNGFDFVGDSSDYLAGYRPTYFLINGEAYPDTGSISVVTGDDFLLRYVNAGLAHHTMSLLGDHQLVIAKDAYPTDANAYQAVAETIPAGSTLDAIVSAGAAGNYPLYSRNLDVTNGGTYPGGMLTSLTVGP